MGRRKKIIKHQVPENLLNQINENFAHGWMIYGYNFDGELQIFSNFDNELAFKALKSDILRYLNSIEMIENQQVLQGVLGSN